MQILDFFPRLGAALLMGAAVGLERQWRQRMAGTRTNALVAAGASVFVMCAFIVRDTSRIIHSGRWNNYGCDGLTGLTALEWDYRTLTSSRQL
jgi:uncharacterized membrane protein